MEMLLAAASPAEVQAEALAEVAFAEAVQPLVGAASADAILR